MKRQAAGALAACMLATMAPIAANAAPLEDAKGHWAESSIQRWNENKVLNGDETGNFNPNKDMSRAEFATMLANMMGYTEKGKNVFADVPDGQWYTDSILKLAAAGVMKGADGCANPNSPISRQEAAVLLCRAMGIDTETVDPIAFADSASVADWALGAVSALAQRGMIGGMGDNMFAPTLDINRASVAKMLDNMVASYVNTDGAVVTGDQKGIVIVAARDVTIKDATLTENLILAPSASGEVKLENVTAKADVEVDAKAKLTADKKTSLGQVTVTAAGAETSIDGKAETVKVAADDVTVSGKGTIQTVTVTEGTNVSVSKDTKVEKVENKSDSKITVGGKEVAPGGELKPEDKPAPSGGSNSGGSSGGSSHPDQGGGTAPVETVAGGHFDATTKEDFDAIFAKTYKSDAVVIVDMGATIADDLVIDDFRGSSLILNFGTYDANSLSITAPDATHIALNDTGDTTEGTVLTNLTINAPKAEVVNSLNVTEKATITAVKNGTFRTTDVITAIDLLNGALAVEGNKAPEINIPASAKGTVSVDAPESSVTVADAPLAQVEIKKAQTVDANTTQPMTISGAVTTANLNSTGAVTITGTVTTANVKAESSVKLESGSSVDDLQITAKANVDVGAGAAVNNTTVDTTAAGTSLTGDGTITGKVTAKADTKVDTQSVSQVEVNGAVEVTITKPVEHVTVTGEGEPTIKANATVGTVTTNKNITLSGTGTVSNVQASGGTTIKAEGTDITVSNVTKIDNGGDITITKDPENAKVTAEARTVNKIEVVTNSLTKAVYLPGDALDLSGLKIKVTYTADDSQASELLVKGNASVKFTLNEGTVDQLISESKTIILTYAGKTATQAITVLDNTELNTAITAANKALAASVVISTDGTDVSPDAQWVTQEMKDNLTTALTAAKASSFVDQEALNTAKNALTQATVAYTPKPGTLVTAASVVEETWETLNNALAAYTGHENAQVITAAGSGSALTLTIDLDAIQAQEAAPDLTTAFQAALAGLSDYELTMDGQKIWSGDKLQNTALKTALFGQVDSFLGTFGAMEAGSDGVATFRTVSAKLTKGQDAFDFTVAIQFKGTTDLARFQSLARTLDAHMKLEPLAKAEIKSRYGVDVSEDTALTVSLEMPDALIQTGIAAGGTQEKFDKNTIGAYMSLLEGIADLSQIVGSNASEVNSVLVTLNNNTDLVNKLCGSMTVNGVKLFDKTFTPGDSGSAWKQFVTGVDNMMNEPIKEQLVSAYKVTEGSMKADGTYYVVPVTMTLSDLNNAQETVVVVLHIDFSTK